MPLRRDLALMCLFVLLLLLAGCGSSNNNGSSSTTPPAVTVSVSPATASVVTGTTQQFTATVANATNTAVTWQVNGVAGGNATVGTISSGGLYTAPASVPSPATVTVTAVSQADSSKTATASVTVTTPPAITVTVSPSTASVVVGAAQQFTATVANTTNTVVTWWVNGVQGGNSTVGTITAGGLYTGPVGVPSPATVTVQAISQADNTKTGSATVTVTAAPTISVTVSPSAPSVQVNATQQFTAAVTGTANTAVTWQVNSVAGGNSTVGTISASGLYTAPASVPNPATVTIKAISSADNTKSGTASATVIASTGSTAKFAYVSSYPGNTVAIYSVDNTTGLLTAAGAVAAGTSPAFLAMHPSGKFLYALNQGSSDISIYTVNSTSGALTPAGTAATSTGPFYMAFTSDGKFAYVTCDSAHAIVGFSVNTTTGALTPVSGSPYTVSAGRVRALAITPDNKFLYTADRDVIGSGIFGYTINGTTGALTNMASAFSGDNIGTLIVDKAGKFVYAGSPDDTVVSAYSLNSSTGALSFVNDYQTGTTNVSVWTFDPTGTYLYGGSTANNNVFGFKQNADGSLTAISGMPVSAATLPNGGGLHPNGKFAYVVSTISETSLAGGVITIYSVNSTTGAWTSINSMPAGVNNTIGFAITP